MKKVLSLVLSAVIAATVMSSDIAVSALSKDRASIQNINYSPDAAKFTMTSLPNDTVLTSNITISGFADKAGELTIIQNGEVIISPLSISTNQVFTEDIQLELGRNEIEILLEDAEGNIGRESLNIVYLTKYDIIVDSSFTGTDGEEINGKKTFKTVQAAINSIPTKNSKTVTIFIKNGTYKEKLKIDNSNISIIGEDKNDTILTYGDASGTSNGSGGTLGTGNSYSLYVTSKSTNFTIENLTIENSFDEANSSFSSKQAVAYRNEADQSMMINCKLIGNQDTLLADAPGFTISATNPLPDTSSTTLKKSRQYYYKTEIEGDVDFIFGRAQAVFDDCDIVSLNRGSNSNNGYITAASTWEKFKYGYLIINSRLLGEDGIAPNTVSLGRPWHPNNYKEANARVAYVNTYMGEHISTKGWDDMSGFLASDADFFESGSYGLGAKESNTRRVLSATDAKDYTLENAFSIDYASPWLPSNTINKMYIPTEVPPSLTLVTEIPSETTEENFEFKGTLDRSGNLTLSLNGKTIINNKKYKANENISATLSLEEGFNEIELVITDTFGNLVTKTYNVTFNKQWGEDLFTISKLVIKDSTTGFKVRKLKSGLTITAEVDVTNNSKFTQNGTIVIGLFDKYDNMISYSLVQDSYDSLETIKASALFTIPSGSNYTVKAFIK